MNKAILWDFDGTLSYPNKSFSTALYDAIAECGHYVDRQTAYDFLENAYSWKAPDITYPDRTGEEWWVDFFRKIDSFCAEAGIERTAFENIHTRFRKILTDVENYSLYDNTLETLKKCSFFGYKTILPQTIIPKS
ncbi:MAG: hypothetical protein E7623_07650 [Ruminococcaceae bacterium]|nr:hypothetical protein [Oscillospiraceae bacterium]